MSYFLLSTFYYLFLGVGITIHNPYRDRGVLLTRLVALPLHPLILLQLLFAHPKVMADLMLEDIHNKVGEFFFGELVEGFFIDDNLIRENVLVSRAAF